MSDTRLAIIAAFNRLVLSTRRARPPVTQLLREAGVARSTLYSHFDDRDSLLLEALGGPLSVIANVSLGRGSQEQLTVLLQHFWDQRNGAKDVLDGPLSKRVTRSLAERLVAQDHDLGREDALRIADSILGYVRLWITGDTPTTAEALAAKIVAGATAQRMAL